MSIKNTQLVYSKIAGIRIAAVLLLAAMLIMLGAPYAQAKSTWRYPRLANYFLDDRIDEAEAIDLAQWDVVILSTEVQDSSPWVFEFLRLRNPDIIILGYVSTIGVLNREISDEFPTMQALNGSAIPDEWKLKASNGEILNYWPGTQMLNVTDMSPRVNGEIWNEWLPRYIAEHIYGTGNWDGIFVDETFGFLSWLNNGDLDLNGDGSPEAKDVIDSSVQAGIQKIVRLIREHIGNGGFVMVNGSSLYQQSTNGRMHETIFAKPEHWARDMNEYQAALNGSAFAPQLSVINANTGNTGVIDEQHIKFTLASTLLSDGFFSYDHGDQLHWSRWWFDFYNINLGFPLGPATNLLEESHNGFVPGLWRRDFDEGVVLVNSMNVSLPYRIELNGQIRTGSIGAYSGEIISLATPGVVSTPEPVIPPVPPASSQVPPRTQGAQTEPVPPPTNSVPQDKLTTEEITEVYRELIVLQKEKQEQSRKPDGPELFEDNPANIAYNEYATPQAYIDTGSGMDVREEVRNTFPEGYSLFPLLSDAAPVVTSDVVVHSDSGWKSIIAKIKQFLRNLVLLVFSA